MLNAQLSVARHCSETADLVNRSVFLRREGANDGDLHPVRRALWRAETRPKSLTKSLEDVTAPPRELVFYSQVCVSHVQMILVHCFFFELLQDKKGERIKPMISGAAGTVKQPGVLLEVILQTCCEICPVSHILSLIRHSFSDSFALLVPILGFEPFKEDEQIRPFILTEGGKTSQNPFVR